MDVVHGHIVELTRNSFQMCIEFNKAMSSDMDANATKHEVKTPQKAKVDAAPREKPQLAEALACGYYWRLGG
ncbi:MAG: hypothetical protein CM15mP120_26620 [Pseudomonadota bacterium]|nr:MAG: hypothetical protein CM15mP120_26620 [Pseudomonadota bacterium]